MLVVAACSLARPTSSAAGGKSAGATGDSSAARGWLAGAMGAGVPWRRLRGCVERGGATGRRPWARDAGNRAVPAPSKGWATGGREREEMLRT
jgi:hypothetical protein